jgi:hypothetical protein
MRSWPSVLSSPSPGGCRKTSRPPSPLRGASGSVYPPFMHPSLGVEQGFREESRCRKSLKPSALHPRSLRLLYGCCPATHSPAVVWPCNSPCPHRRGLRRRRRSPPRRRGTGEVLPLPVSPYRLKIQGPGARRVRIQVHCTRIPLCFEILLLINYKGW